MATLIHPDQSFSTFIDSLLKKAKLRKEHRAILMTRECMIEWTKVFTSKGTNPTHNYELYETFGDGMANTVVLMYFKKRFPQYFNPTKPIHDVNGMGVVGVLSRLKQVGVSKDKFAKYGHELGFRPYIRATEEEVMKSKSLLEDVFEAFIGCLAIMIDTKMSEYFGYGVVSEFMKPLMEKEEISLNRFDLYDPKSILNEDIGYFMKRMISLKYVEEPSEFTEPQDFRKFKKVRLVLRNQGEDQRVIYISEAGYGPKLKEAEQQSVQYTLSDPKYKMLLSELNKQKEREMKERPVIPQHQQRPYHQQEYVRQPYTQRYQKFPPKK